MNLREKLQIIQAELKAPKGQYNSFGKYKYRNCEDIQEAVKPLLAKNKTSLVAGDEIVTIGARFYVKATVTLFDCESEESIVNIAYAREEESKKGMDGSQVTGASSSYARKYALNGLFCIDDTKDSDSTNVGGVETQKSTAKTTQPNKMKEPTEAEIMAMQEKTAKQKIDATKISVIKSEILRTGINEQSICGRYKVAGLEEITEDVFAKVINALKNTKSKENKDE